ncbi:MAG: hypothetical protein CM15mV57_030 [uncultured marine virus]|nr:MAG: hypothetical protein CM15mV57_030 [uncultured marine virus]
MVSQNLSKCDRFIVNFLLSPFLSIVTKIESVCPNTTLNPASSAFALIDRSALRPPIVIVLAISGSYQENLGKAIIPKKTPHSHWLNIPLRAASYHRQLRFSFSFVLYSSFCSSAKNLRKYPKRVLQNAPIMTNHIII